MKTTTERYKNNLWQLLIYLLTAPGICYCIMNGLGFEVSVFAVTLWLILVFVLLEICLIRWYILPSLLALAAVVILILLANHNETIFMLTERFQSLFIYLSNPIPKDPDNYILLLPMLMLALTAVGSITYVFVSKLTTFLPLGIAIICFYAYTQMLFWQDTYVPTMLAVIAVFIKMSYAYYGRHEALPSASILLTPAIIILLSILFTSSSIKDTKYPVERTWRWLRMISADINDAMVNETGLRVISMPRDLFNTEKAGVSMEGGPLNPDENPFLLVDAPNNTLLRGSIQNYYTGYSWQNTVPKTQHRFESNMWQKQMDTTFSLEISMWDEIPRELQRMLSIDSVIRVQHLRQDTSTLYGAGRVYDVKSNVGDTIIPYFDMNGDMFSKYYVNARASYNIKTYLINYDSPRFDELMSDISLHPISDPYIKKNYLQLPEALPKNIYSLTERLTRDKLSEYDKAIAIRNYLLNFSYSLAPPLVPDDSDFVDYFLHTREGYCVYFASTMAVMARSAGIPSRYVQGFYVPEHPYGRSVYLTGENAHAWAELYFEGIGWIPFDATPRDSMSEILSVSDDSVFIPIFPTEPVLESSEQHPFDLFPIEQDNDSPSSTKTAKTIIVTLIVLIVVIFLLLPIMLLRRDLSEKYIALNYPDIRLRLEKYYENALQVISDINKDIQLGDTPYMVAAQTSALSYENRDNFRELTESVVRMRYANILPTDFDISRADHITNEIEREYRTLKGFIYYYRVRLFNTNVFRKTQVRYYRRVKLIT
ncbi:MAG: transglutaminase-like domain-containing protein [Oscillospiraceae bacterium]|nr:transglutaminase-like domain-containing protein [Oscillospiraceae bacterium]